MENSQPVCLLVCVCVCAHLNELPHLSICSPFLPLRLQIRGNVKKKKKTITQSNTKAPAVAPRYYNKGKVILCYRSNQVPSTTFKLKTRVVTGTLEGKSARFPVSIIPLNPHCLSASLFAFLRDVHNMLTHAHPRQRHTCALKCTKIRAGEDKNERKRRV